MKTEKQKIIIQNIARAIKQSDKIVLFHHVRADGDTVSCSYGLLKALQSKFPEKTIKWVADQEYLSTNFGYLNIDFENAIDGSEVDHSWTAIMGDSAVKARIHGWEVYKKAGVKICFDHHNNDIDFEADFYWREPNYIASSLQAVQIQDELGIKRNSRIACLSLVGILTDSNFFKMSLNQQLPLQIATELMKDIDRNDLQKIYTGMDQRTATQVKTTAYALQNYISKDQVAFIHWTDKLINEYNTSADQIADPEVIANIKDIGIWMAFTDYKDDNFTRLEIRSNGCPVDKIATKFGGGGHTQAAGASLTYQSQTMINDVVEEAIKQYQEYKKSS